MESLDRCPFEEPVDIREIMELPYFMGMDISPGFLRKAISFRRRSYNNRLRGRENYPGHQWNQHVARR